MSKFNLLESAFEAEKKYTGLAGQVAKAVRVYFEREFTRNQQEITFLIEAEKRKNAYNANTITNTVRRAKKAIEDSL